MKMGSLFLEIIKYLEEIDSRPREVEQFFIWLENSGLIDLIELEGYYLHILEKIKDENVLVFGVGILRDFENKYPEIFKEYRLHKISQKLFEND